MARLLDRIKVLSANCRELKNKIKRYNIINYLKNTKADIICLQDTHLTNSDTAEVKDKCDEEFILRGM